MSQEIRRDVLIVMEGNPLVGKHSLRHRFLMQSFSSKDESSIIFTVKKTFRYLKATRLELSIWATAGKKDMCGCSHCCFLVFDVSNRESFEALDSWLKSCIEKILPEGKSSPIAVIGNKIDKRTRTVSTQEAQKWCDDRLIPYFECSAQDGTNVKAAFQALLLRVMNSRT